MAVLDHFTDKQTFESAEITIPATGPVQLLVRGGFGADGLVRLLLKGADNQFHAYRELTFQDHNSAVEIGLFAGDVVKLVFTDCSSASAELRQ